ncbi:MAG: clostripain-related cysteine peptidase, partial [Nitrososphaerales archaeon]
MSPDTSASKWTVLVYMAGDTGATFEGTRGDVRLFGNLSGPLKADLEKLAAAGSTEQVNVCVQYDSFGSQTAYRWVVPPKGAQDACGPEPIGAVNTGEPGSLTDFIAWAGQRCPAGRYALVIWGHGTGWSEDQIYARFPAAQTATRDAPASRRRLLDRGIFASSAGKIMQIEDDQVRGLCYDDSSRDFLDNRDLQQALAGGAQALGRDRIDVLGLDACLMCMIEVAYQVRGEVAALAGSETVLPTALWPWEDLLAALQAQPDMSATDLALR